MDEKIVYFKKPGKVNTDEVIELVLERARLRKINCEEQTSLGGKNNE